MIRARLVHGPFHGHTDRLTRAPEWVTVDPACPCCSAPHLVEIDADRPDQRPVYQLHFADSHTAEYRYVLGPDDAETAAMLDEADLHHLTSARQRAVAVDFR